VEDSGEGLRHSLRAHPITAGRIEKVRVDHPGDGVCQATRSAGISAARAWQTVRWVCRCVFRHHIWLMSFAMVATATPSTIAVQPPTSPTKLARRLNCKHAFEIEGGEPCSITTQRLLAGPR
jgi:hypothetical protein